jgi:curved DNA-binding protein CbpA
MDTIDNTGFYNILGVQKAATPGEIKRAYYLRARQCHPDKNPDNPEAEAEVRIMNRSTMRLFDSTCRKRHICAILCFGCF